MVSAAGPLLERVDQSWRTWLLAQLVHAALALGRTAEAERWTAVIEERAALMPTIGTRSRAAGARAAMLLAGGEPAEAARLAGATADAAALANSRLDAMPALLIAGRAHAAAGDRDAAVAALQSVAQHAGQGGAGLFVEAAARELRRLGTRLSAESRRATAGDDLTERERDDRRARGAGPDQQAGGRGRCSCPRRRSSTTCRAPTRSSGSARASS